MLLARKGCISQREGPRYRRIFLTLSVLIKPRTRYSSTCLEVGCHFKLLCACANVATTWHCHGYQVASVSLSRFPPGNEASRSPGAPERTLFSVGRRAGSRLLRLFTPQSAEASRIQPKFSVGSGCVDLSVFREDKGQKKYPQKKYSNKV